MPPFYTKDGWLTRYALACGYRHLQTRADRQDVLLTCVCSEIPLYLVRRYDGPDRTFESFTTSISFARRQFRLAMGERLQRHYEKRADVRRRVIT